MQGRPGIGITRSDKVFQLVSGWRPCRIDIVFPLEMSVSPTLDLREMNISDLYCLRAPPAARTYGRSVRNALGLIALVWVFASFSHAEDRSTLVVAKLQASKVSVDGDGVVDVPTMTVPFSSFASPQAKAAFLESQKSLDKWMNTLFTNGPPDIAKQRRAFVERFQPALDRTRAIYPVDVVSGVFIGGVSTDVITPKGGIPAGNKNRVLINLHGGGFLWGAHIMGALESVPVAGLGKIKVITVDYRQGPEHKFPAASEDVIAVYRALLERYKPESIGIYGCSAGGLLTAEAIAWIGKEKLPLPGAIGIFCASAAGWSGGDSGAVALPLSGTTVPPNALAPPHPEVSNSTYFSDADFADPLVMPVRSSDLLKRFPPTLIVTSTRDSAMSPAVYTHAQLTRLGVDAELHVWEGLGHGFFTTDPDFPETREVWSVVVKFFDRHLATN